VLEREKEGKTVRQRIIIPSNLPIATLNIAKQVKICFWKQYNYLAPNPPNNIHEKKKKNLKTPTSSLLTKILYVQPCKAHSDLQPESKKFPTATPIQGVTRDYQPVYICTLIYSTCLTSYGVSLEKKIATSFNIEIVLD